LNIPGRVLFSRRVPLVNRVCSQMSLPPHSLFLLPSPPAPSSSQRCLRAILLRQPHSFVLRLSLSLLAPLPLSMFCCQRHMQMGSGLVARKCGRHVCHFFVFKSEPPRSFIVPTSYRPSASAVGLRLSSIVLICHDQPAPDTSAELPLLHIKVHID
jgi:hypothetical protein